MTDLPLFRTALEREWREKQRAVLYARKGTRRTRLSELRTHVSDMLRREAEERRAA